MRLDLAKYSVNRAFVQKYAREHSHEDLETGISLLAVSTHCPITCICFYIAEDIGFIPEICLIIDKLILFYHYTKILNQLPGSPYLTRFGENDIKL